MKLSEKIGSAIIFIINFVCIYFGAKILRNFEITGKGLQDFLIFILSIGLILYGVIVTVLTIRDIQIKKNEKSNSKTNNRT